VLAGGGVKGGYVHGRSDAQAAYPAEHPVAPRDLIASVYHLLGVPEEQVLADAGGRPSSFGQGKRSRIFSSETAPGCVDRFLSLSLEVRFLELLQHLLGEIWAALFSPVVAIVGQDGRP